ncbi:hypothetical protein R9208_17925 [Flammeovirgaceae bacterium SG7u.132]|nr:hypothetical protein [Flammeovirgaceae bacterium SG7u.132]
MKKYFLYLAKAKVSKGANIGILPIKQVFYEIMMGKRLSVSVS